MNATIVIPARLASTRLPRKLLLRETGKSLLQHTCEAAAGSRLAKEVLVAVDDPELADEVDSFGGKWVMTSPDHPSGTDRVAEVARQLAPGILVNVQGDEPDIPGDAIDAVIQRLIDQPALDVATLATPIRTREKLDDPACVKVVADAEGRALYFSRSPIPHPREWKESLLSQQPPVFWQHVGVYGYRSPFLEAIAKSAPSPLERVESLEQLRFLETGFRIGVVPIDRPLTGIDTPADYAAFVRSRSTGI